MSQLGRERKRLFPETDETRSSESKDAYDSKSIVASLQSWIFGGLYQTESIDIIDK